MSRTKKTADIGSTAKRIKHICAPILVIAAAIIVGIIGCDERRGGDSERVQNMPRKTIEQVQREHTSQWMAIDGVEGTAIGLFEGKPCIKIFSSKRAEELQGDIPSTVEGYSVIIEETGTFRALER